MSKWKSRRTVQWHSLLHGYSQPVTCVLWEISGKCVHAANSSNWNYMTVKCDGILFTFSVFKQANHSELCKDCKVSYKKLNELYGKMEENQTLCIDIEDAVSLFDFITLKYRTHIITKTQNKIYFAQIGIDHFAGCIQHGIRSHKDMCLTFWFRSKCSDGCFLF